MIPLTPHQNHFNIYRMFTMCQDVSCNTHNNIIRGTITFFILQIRKLKHQLHTSPNKTIQLINSKAGIQKWASELAFLT